MNFILSFFFLAKLNYRLHKSNKREFNYAIDNKNLKNFSDEIEIINNLEDLKIKVIWDKPFLSLKNKSVFKHLITIFMLIVIVWILSLIHFQ